MVAVHVEGAGPAHGGLPERRIKAIAPGRLAGPDKHAETGGPGLLQDIGGWPFWLAFLGNRMHVDGKSYRAGRAARLRLPWYSGRPSASSPSQPPKRKSANRLAAAVLFCRWETPFTTGKRFMGMGWSPRSSAEPWAGRPHAWLNRFLRVRRKSWLLDPDGQEHMRRISTRAWRPDLVPSLVHCQGRLDRNSLAVFFDERETQPHENRGDSETFCGFRSGSGRHSNQRSSDQVDQRSGCVPATFRLF